MLASIHKSDERWIVTITQTINAIIIADALEIAGEVPDRSKISTRSEGTLGSQYHDSRTYA